MNLLARQFGNHGFTLIELLTVISIIGLLSTIVMSSLQSAKIKARDAQVKMEVRSIINALYLARDDATGQFPGLSDWQCLKASGTCWQGSYSGNSTISNALAPYIPRIPLPPNPPFGPSTYLYGGYLYAANLPSFYNSPAGAYIIWAQSVPITNCQGFYLGNYDGNYYCYQHLP